MLTNEQIQENWDRFLDIIATAGSVVPVDKISENNRWKILYNFYQKYEQRFAFMPASGKVSFHSAFPGGHISHTLRVYDTALRLSGLWQELGATIDFTRDELIFTAINHDIGKFGTYEAETFIDQDSEWHRKQGEIYKHNHEVPFMKDYDRSIFLLQDLGVRMSETEYLAIKLQSGLYEESNKSYFIAYKPEFKLHSNLPYIIHQADAMSARIESGSSKALATPKPKATRAVKVVPLAPVKPPTPKNKFSKYL